MSWDLIFISVIREIGVVIVFFFTTMEPDCTRCANHSCLPSRVKYGESFERYSLSNYYIRVLLLNRHHHWPNYGMHICWLSEFGVYGCEPQQCSRPRQVI